MKGLELAKWIAFAAMVCDHVDTALYGGSVPWLHALGRMALPTFAVCFGIGLAHSSNPLRSAERLLLPAIVAQVVWAFLPGRPQLNILGVFCAVALVASWYESRRLFLAVPAAMFLLWSSSNLEAGWGGLALVAGAFAAERMRAAWPNFVAAVPWLLLAPSPGLAAGLVLPHAARWFKLEVERVPGLFAWAYAGHLAVLVALRVLVR